MPGTGDVHIQTIILPLNRSVREDLEKFRVHTATEQSESQIGYFRPHDQHGALQNKTMSSHSTGIVHLADPERSGFPQAVPERNFQDLQSNRSTQLLVPTVARVGIQQLLAAISRVCLEAYTIETRFDSRLDKREFVFGYPDAERHRRS